MKEKKQKQAKTCSYISGFGVREGVVMRGKHAIATAVRDPEGKIQIETERIVPKKGRKKLFRIPFLRGLFNFIDSVNLASKGFYRATAVTAKEESEIPTKGEKWLAEKHKIDIRVILKVVLAVVGVFLAFVGFILVPYFLAESISLWRSTTGGLEQLWFNLIEGAIRWVLFCVFMLIVGIIPALKHTYMCHGAEHKVLNCYEHDEELTVENVKKYSRVHERCGTSTLFLVMVSVVVIFSLVNMAFGYILYWGQHIGKEIAIDHITRICFMLLILPVALGVSYEIMHLLTRTKSKFFWIFKFPGLLMQRLTTREPDDKMIECAIVAFKKVEEMDADPTIPESRFVTLAKMHELLGDTKKRFAQNNIDGEEAEWIFAIKLGMPKSAVASEERILKRTTVKALMEVIDERLTGRPLWYIIGDTDFYGYKLKVDERVLIPRPETEELALQVINSAEDGYEILDLCTGSGAIAITVFNELKDKNVFVHMTASDISEGALQLAMENAEEHRAKIKFVKSDMFEKIKGKYNIIVSNPPYIPTAEIETLQREVKDHEPRGALDGGEDGLDFYRIIAREAPKYLVEGGMIIMEVGKGQAESIVKMFKKCDYAIIVKDMAGVDRFVKIVM